MKEKKPHWIRLQFDEDFNHFLVDGSYKHTPGNMFLDGFVAAERFKQYLTCLMAEVEDFKRKEKLDVKLGS